MSSVWLDLLALALYGPLIVLLHEVGHATFARLGGYRITDFGVGMGKPLWRMALRRGAVLHVDRWVFLGGSCTAIPIGPPSARRAWFHVGGLVFQVGLAGALLPFLTHPLAQQIFVFNGLVWLHNALPWRVGAWASDGWQVLEVLGAGPRASSVLTQRAAIERMTERADVVQSPLGSAYGRVVLAWADVIAGRPDHAAPLFRDDPPATTLDPWIDALYHYVKASWERAGGRPLAALRTAREAHHSVDLASASDAEALIALAEARALVDLDAPRQALAALSRAAGVGGALGWQAAAIRLWASLDGEAEALEAATWRLLHRLNQPGYDPADGAMALWEAAATLEERGRTEAARAARSGARDLAQRLVRRTPTRLRAPLVRRMGAVAGLGPPGVAATGGADRV